MIVSDLFNIDTWLGSFTSNLFSDVLVAIFLGVLLLRWLDKVEKRKERKENNKIITNLIASELEYNQKQLKLLISETPKGNVVFPGLETSVWDIIDKTEFISFYRPENIADILNIYRRIKSINRMYDALLESSNWTVSGRVTIVRKEFVDKFTERCEESLNYLNDFFADIEYRRVIKREGLKYQGIPVRKKPKLWELLPWLSSYTAQAIYPNIFVSSEVFEHLHRLHPDHRFIAVLEHEKKHVERQKQIGFVKFGVKYLFSSKFRWQEELLAIKAGMKYLKQNKLTFDIDKSAKFLSSWLYFWMVPYKKAKKELDLSWKELEKL